MPSNHLILCRPLFLLPSIFHSIKVFSNESALCIRWPKYWSFSFNISPSNEHSGLISFTLDLLDFLAVQGTLKIILQHHSSKASMTNLDSVLKNRDITLPTKVRLVKAVFCLFVFLVVVYGCVRASLMAQRLNVCLQCGRPGFDPWVRKIPWRRK